MKKIRIALMTHTMDNRPGMGTATVARKTVEGLVADDQFDVTFVHYEKIADPLYERAREIVIPPLPELFFGTRFLRFLLFCWKYRKENFDIVHWFQPRLYPFFWLFPARNIVITAHGGGDALAPQKFSLSKKIFVFIFRHFHSRIDAVVASSNSGKKEIIEAYGIPENKIVVIYLGGSEGFSPLEKRSAANPYILTVSRLVPHKNVGGLIRAYALARNMGISQRLIIVGGRGGAEESVYAEARRSPYRSDIMFVDYAPLEDLKALYAGADLFVFPSLNEGWGMPIIEAFASGVPVVATNLTAVPEAVGDAALLVDPRDERALAGAVAQVLTDKSLSERMVQAGFVQASKFTWDRMARAVTEVYKKLI